MLETDIFLKLETLIYINHFFEQPFFHPKNIDCVYSKYLNISRAGVGRL